MIKSGDVVKIYAGETDWEVYIERVTENRVYYKKIVKL